jgi:osmotically-inducible protein OsmY
MKTDAQLRQDVQAELEWEPAVHAAGIGVEVKHGTVTLTGHVDSFAEKWHAEQAAQRIAGVKGLAVEIDVKLPGISRRTDSDIAGSADNVLQWTSFLPRDAVKVKVEDGWITLSGELEWEYQRQAATSAVRNLMGVRGVSENIHIKPVATLKAVRTEIEAALRRRAQDDSQQIVVEVRGSEVTLSGKAPSWSERDLATSSAWATPGVYKVVDNITIGG